jgi:hypothetical protein
VANAVNGVKMKRPRRSVNSIFMGAVMLNWLWRSTVSMIDVAPIATRYAV